MEQWVLFNPSSSRDIYYLCNVNYFCRLRQANRVGAIQQRR